jgi:heat shock protein HslJ
MKRLLLVLPLVMLSGCGYYDGFRQKEPPPKPFAGTQWNVVLELPLAGEQPWFKFGDGRMEGFGGCNRVNARYIQDTVGARAIAIGAISASKRMCDQSPMAAEQRVLEVLQAVSSYSVTADTMTMTGSAGTLKFKAQLTEEELKKLEEQAKK